ncbi:hypothetical protein EYF80_051278 [Liparis tanakae]|uniref:Uncharacterized protein n=1 Tax=Liparis tanakae TaxID=230148 RepID=A0A4Z2FCQ8_9TELE|nr:hypothetical protein EYF80_051278 [Liparis tanakae]
MYRKLREDVADDVSLAGFDEGDEVWAVWVCDVESVEPRALRLEASDMWRESASRLDHFSVFMAAAAQEVRGSGGQGVVLQPQGRRFHPRSPR